MIEYLEQLVEEGRHREVLAEAERLIPLLIDPQDILTTHIRVVVAHCCLGQWREALASGAVAINLAEEQSNWDAYGMVTLYVGNAYSRLGQYDEAIAYMYQYLTSLGKYGKAAAHEAIAWFNLGTWLLLLRRPDEAIKCLWDALAAAERTKNHRSAHGVRQALVEAHLQVGMLQPVPRLLAKSGHYLRMHEGTQSITNSHIFHLKLRSQHALVTNRLRRAEILAVRGLELGLGTEHEFWFHRLLSNVSQNQNDVMTALDHAHAARCCGIRENRPDLEAEANAMISALSKLPR